VFWLRSRLELYENGGGAVRIYEIYDSEFNEIHFLDVRGILEEVNRDRSDGWTPYDESDWYEGMTEWTGFEIKKVYEESHLLKQSEIDWLESLLDSYGFDFDYDNSDRAHAMFDFKTKNGDYPYGFSCALEEVSKRYPDINFRKQGDGTGDCVTLHFSRLKLDIWGSPIYEDRHEFKPENSYVPERS
jgi:hypothetical protein